MGRPVDLELRRTWRELLSRQRTSGLSVAEFCRAEGVSEASYYGWRRRLGRDAKAPERRNAQQRGAISVDGSAEAAVRFVQLPVAALPHSAAVELTLTDGTKICVPSQASEALERIVGLLLDHIGRLSDEVRHD